MHPRSALAAALAGTAFGRPPRFRCWRRSRAPTPGLAQAILGQASRPRGALYLYFVGYCIILALCITVSVCSHFEEYDIEAYSHFSFITVSTGSYRCENGFEAQDSRMYISYVRPPLGVCPRPPGTESLYRVQRACIGYRELVLGTDSLYMGTYIRWVVSAYSYLCGNELGANLSHVFSTFALL